MPHDLTSAIAVTLRCFPDAVILPAAGCDHCSAAQALIVPYTRLPREPAEPDIVVVTLHQGDCPLPADR